MRKEAMEKAASSRLGARKRDTAQTSIDFIDEKRVKHMLYIKRRHLLKLRAIAWEQRDSVSGHFDMALKEYFDRHFSETIDQTLKAYKEAKGLIE